VLRTFDVRGCPGIGEKEMEAIREKVEANAEATEGKMYGAGTITEPFFLIDLNT